MYTTDRRVETRKLVISINRGTALRIVCVYVLCPIHTADADTTKLFCRVGVGGVNTIRN